MKSRIALCTLVACSVVTAAVAVTRADAIRMPFAPVTVTPSTFTEDVVFSPDNKTLFLTRAAVDDPAQRTIIMLERDGAKWTDPQVAPFSGRWRDLEEILTPDGRTMIFASNRPASDGSGAIDGFFGGKPQPGRGGNLWSVRWNGSAWGTPERLPDAINTGNSVFSPAVTRDGTLYFMRNTLPGPRFHLYVAKLEDGMYRSSAPAPFGDPRYSDFDPTVAPDGSFVIFGSNRPPSPAGGSDLFITFLRNEAWSTPVDMGSSINQNHDAIEPRLSTDANTLYFLSEGKLWSADLTRKY